MNELAKIMPALKILSIAVIVAGNSCDDSYIPLLAGNPSSSSPSNTCTQCLGYRQTGRQECKELLITAQAKEKDRDVQREISLALQKVTEID